jgi:hypothetical protein
MRVLAVLLACVAICIATGCGGAPRPNGWGHAPLIRAPALARPELAVLRATPAGGTSNVDLLVMTREGLLLRVLAGDSISKTMRPAFGDRPTWSPDGRRIAFSGVAGRGSSRFAANAKPDVFVVDADGSRLRRVTHSGDVSGPVWSQDGKWIVFGRQFGRDYPWRFALWMIRPDGSDARQILPAVKARVVVPGSFSPDGSCTTPLTYDDTLDPSYDVPAWRPGLPRRGGGRLTCRS